MSSSQPNKSRVSFGKSFYRYNVAAFFATVTDFTVMTFLHYTLGVHYIWATAAGALSGAIVAFFLGRNWAFQNKDGAISKQAIKFMIVSGGSLLLNIGGMALVVEVLQFENVLFARFLVSLTVGIFFNFPLQRYFVYR